MGENFNGIYSAHNAFFKAGSKTVWKKYGKSDKADKGDSVHYQELQHSPRVSFRNLDVKKNPSNPKPKQNPKISIQFP